MWEPVGEPNVLSLPEEAHQDSIAAWIQVRSTSPMDPVPDVTTLRFVDPSEASRFAMAKRAEEHAAARWLVEYLLVESGRNPKLFKIERDDYRRPRLVGPNAPSLTITHSGGVAAVLLGPKEIDIGLDLEPMNLRPRNLLCMMSSGKEKAQLESLYDQDEMNASFHTTDVWVAKEAILKAAGLGMGLPPQSFEVHGKNVIEVGINGANNIFNLHRWKATLNGQLTSLAIAEKV